MNIEIYGTDIKLGQLLKKQGYITTGGTSKRFIAKHEIKINGKSDVTRNTLVRVDDVLWIDDSLFKITGGQEASASAQED